MFSPVRFLVNLFLYLEMFGLQKVSLYFDSPRKATCANVAEFSLNHYIAFLNSLYELTPYSDDIKKNCHVVYATLRSKEVRNILKDQLEFLPDAFYCFGCYFENLGGLKLGKIHFIFKQAKTECAGEHIGQMNDQYFL